MSEPYRIYKGELEVHISRGVIYFHDESGFTILRICQLDLARAEAMDRPFIDVTFGHGVSIQNQGVAGEFDDYDPDPEELGEMEDPDCE